MSKCYKDYLVALILCPIFIGGIWKRVEIECLCDIALEKQSSCLHLLLVPPIVGINLVKSINAANTTDQIPCHMLI